MILCWEIPRTFSDTNIYRKTEPEHEHREYFLYWSVSDFAEFHTSLFQVFGLLSKLYSIREIMVMELEQETRKKFNFVGHKIR